jgi:hypothetical protein
MLKRVGQTACMVRERPAGPGAVLGLAAATCILQVVRGSAGVSQQLLVLTKLWQSAGSTVLTPRTCR